MKTLMAVAATFALAASSSALAGAVVVGTNSPIGTMDAEEAKRVFLGHGAPVGGQAILVVYHSADDARTDFETKILGKTGANLQSYWSTLVFTGRAAPPVEVAGDHGVKAKVAENPNAVGYISDGAVDSTVKVIFKY